MFFISSEQLNSCFEMKMYRNIFQISRGGSEIYNSESFNQSDFSFFLNLCRSNSEKLFSSIFSVDKITTVTPDKSIKAREFCEKLSVFVLSSKKRQKFKVMRVLICCFFALVLFSSVNSGVSDKKNRAKT